MTARFDRRAFAVGLGGGLLGLLGRPAQARPLLSIGCAGITWGDANAAEAIREIGEAGYRGVQLRADGLKAFPSPAALQKALARARLTFTCLSGGAPDPDPGKRAAEIDKFMAGVTFAKAAGVLALQVTSPTYAAGAKAVSRATLESFAATLTALGKRTAEVGLPLGFHPQVNQFGRTLDEIDVILQASDPRYVKLLLDTGHHTAAGGDAAAMLAAHGRRLMMVHFKDVQDSAANAAGETYRFVELGQGKVDFRAVLAALTKIRYSGWVVVEMRPERVRDGHSAKDMAVANRVYLEKTLGLVV
jgi:inosose dehydratase